MTQSADDRAQFTVRRLHPGALAPADAAAWNALRAAHADYASPLLSPGFAQVAGRARPDAEIALIEDAAGLAAVLAYYRRPDDLGRPIGAPFCDYSGPVVRHGAALTLRAIVALCGLAGWRSLSLVDPWDLFGAERTGERSSLIVRLAGQTATDYLESRRALHPKRFKNFRRLDNQFAREGHALDLRFGAVTAPFTHQLHSLKSAQYRASGLVDLIAAREARALLDTVASDVGGFQTSLWVGDTLIAGHFGYREGAAFHPWIAAYNPDYAHFSPGNILLRRVIEAMPDMGLDTYDLAEGSDHYKKYYTNAGTRVFEADVTGVGLRAGALTAGQVLWRLAGAANERSVASRLRRRIDQAAVSDFRLGARLGDLATALRKRREAPANDPHGQTSADA